MIQVSEAGAELMQGDGIKSVEQIIHENFERARMHGFSRLAPLEKKVTGYAKPGSVNPELISLSDIRSNAERFIAGLEEQEDTVIEETPALLGPMSEDPCLVAFNRFVEEASRDSYEVIEPKRSKKNLPSLESQAEGLLEQCAATGMEHTHRQGPMLEIQSPKIPSLQKLLDECVASVSTRAERKVAKDAANALKLNMAIRVPRKKFLGLF